MLTVLDDATFHTPSTSPHGALHQRKLSITSHMMNAWDHQMTNPPRYRNIITQAQCLGQSNNNSKMYAETRLFQKHRFSIFQSLVEYKLIGPRIPIPTLDNEQIRVQTRMPTAQSREADFVYSK